MTLYYTDIYIIDVLHPHIILNIDDVLKEKTNDQNKDMKEAFQSFDEDDNGTIDIEELKIKLSSYSNAAEEKLQEESQELMKWTDIDGNRLIDFNEFIEWMSEFNNEQDLHEAFQNLDTDGSGKISSSELKQAMEPISVSQIQAIIKEGDADGDGEIDFEEFMPFQN